MAQFKQYNKENGMYIGESDIPVIDPEIGNTEVLLPNELMDGIVYVFDESIQMWRTMTPEQFEEHLQQVIPPHFSSDDEFKQFATIKLMELEERIAELEEKENSREASV